MKISAVIPAYNEEAHITQCLISLLNQDEKPDEIIVVDNNSTDTTVDIVKQFPVKLIHEEKQGIIHARNAGFNSAEGDLIVRTDADTRVPTDWIKKIKKNFTDNPKLIGLSGPAHFYDLENFLQTSQWETRLIFCFIKSQIKHNTLYGPNMAIRQAVWQHIKTYVCNNDTDVHEDTDIALHAGKYGLISIDTTLVVSTSARRYKKLITYYSYPLKLFKTIYTHKIYE